MATIHLAQLAKASVHLGHKTSNWNLKCSRLFILKEMGFIF